MPAASPFTALGPLRLVAAHGGEGVFPEPCIHLQLGIQSDLRTLFFGRPELIERMRHQLSAADKRRQHRHAGPWNTTAF
ncbi:hypothetical protein ACVBEH_18980 [Roseateles sp. GG27B]